MKRNLKLTWQAGADGRNGRWRKKYNGKNYYFAGGRGKSDREAYQQALSEWETKKGKIDEQLPKRHQDEYKHAISEWQQVLVWSRKHGDQAMAGVAEEKCKRLEREFRVAAPKPLKDTDRFQAQFEMPTIDLSIIDGLLNGTRVLDSRLLTGLRPLVVSDEDRARYMAELDGSTSRIQREIWMDRIATQQRDAGPTEDTLKARMEELIERKQVQALAGDLSDGRVYRLKILLRHFEIWAGAEISVHEIDEKLLEEYHSYLLQGIAEIRWSRAAARDRIAAVKAFVRVLWRKNVIANLPRNLDGKDDALNINRSSPKIVVYNSNEIVSLVESASPRTRLYVLLMLNCGMTQKDIADLVDTEVDWKRGRISRRRSKTRRHSSVPEVDYLLWPETFALLKSERARNGSDRVLVNANGSPLWSEKFQNGKYWKIDNVKSAFDRLRRKTKIKKTLVSLKKTSATLIRSNPQFASLPTVFLGHAADTIAHRHYAAAPQGLLDEAITWLRDEHKIAGACKQSGTRND